MGSSWITGIAVHWFPMANGISGNYKTVVIIFKHSVQILTSKRALILTFLWLRFLYLRATLYRDRVRLKKCGTRLEKWTP